VSDRLAEVRSKLARAQEHDDTWTAEVGSWLDGEPYGVHGQYEGEWFVLRFRELEKAPFVRLALIFADYLHNLRGTLEHLVWHLVETHSSSASEHTGFPVVVDPNKWNRALGGKLLGFPSEFVGVVKDAQPFNHRTDPTAHWLYLLHHLDIREKHRLIVRLAVSAFEWEPTFELSRNAIEGDGVISGEPDGPVELVDGAELARCRVVSEHNDLRIVQIQTIENASLGVGPFSDVIPRTVARLPDMLGPVQKIIDDLAPAFIH
jgi:hypothetical protein